MGRKSKETTEEERRIAIQCLQNGKTFKEIAKILNRPISTVRSVIYRYNRTRTYKNKPRKGRPSVLTPVESRQIVRNVNIDPKLWTSEVNYQVTEHLGRESISQDNTNDSAAWSNGEIKVETGTKEEAAASELIIQNEWQFFSKNLVSYSNDNSVQIKIEIKEEPLVSEYFQQNGTEFCSVMKTEPEFLQQNGTEFCSVTKTEPSQKDYEIESQENTSLEEIQDGMNERLTSTKPIRLHTGIEPTSKSVLFCDEQFGKEVRFSITKNNPPQRKQKRTLSDLFGVPTVENGVPHYLSSCLEKHNNTQIKKAYKKKQKKLLLAQYKSSFEFKCETCKKRFTSGLHLIKHTLLGVCTRRNKCDVCDLNFSDLAVLQRHKLIHADIRSHKCSVCHKSFTLLVDLRSHELRHPTFKCYTCGRKFTNLEHLEIHGLIHKRDVCVNFIL